MATRVPLPHIFHREATMDRARAWKMSDWLWSVEPGAEVWQMTAEISQELATPSSWLRVWRSVSSFVDGSEKAMAAAGETLHSGSCVLACLQAPLRTSIDTLIHFENPWIGHFLFVCWTANSSQGFNQKCIDMWNLLVLSWNYMELLKLYELIICSIGSLDGKRTLRNTVNALSRRVSHVWLQSPWWVHLRHFDRNNDGCISKQENMRQGPQMVITCHWAPSNVNVFLATLLLSIAITSFSLTFRYISHDH